MKQPEIPDIGTKMDVVRHRLNVAREDLDTAKLTFEAGQYRLLIEQVQDQRKEKMRWIILT